MIERNYLLHPLKMQNYMKQMQIDRHTNVLGVKFVKNSKDKKYGKATFSSYCSCKVSKFLGLSMR